MKLRFLPLLLLIAYFNASAQSSENVISRNNLSKPAAVFEENKGQMKDQHWKPRPDVLFYGSQQGMNYYIKNNGVSFQLSRVDSWREEDNRFGMPEIKKSKVPEQISTYRVDEHWIAHNPIFVVEQGKALDGYNNYYNVPDGVEPALFVKQFESVILKNVWNGIDINYYGTDGQLETDYLVSPGADYRQIQIEIKGAELSISNDGNLIMKTPFGEIHEGELKVYQKNERLQAFWKIEDKNRVSFVIPNFDPLLALRIDPVTRSWGTYYGGLSSLGEDGYSTITDKFCNVYLAGETNSATNISSGGHQNTYGGSRDNFLVKFNSSGARLWGTYYGGANSEFYWTSTATDASGNVFLAGSTRSTSGIASSGYQNTLSSGGNADAYLVKFNGSGIRQWGTYYGGTGNDYGFSTATDAFGNIYLAGMTTSTTGIAFAGHQNTYGGGFNYGDAFLVKFNTNGVRQWGTYYGGPGDENYIMGKCSLVATDLVGNVYLSGSTSSSSGIASAGHQNSLNGSSSDAFLVKFNSSGLRQWGTYYGGPNSDSGCSTTTDLLGNVYLAGSTNSTTAIALGGYQNAFAGGINDVFLVKFNSGGSRQWATYYGGGADESVNVTTVTDRTGSVYLAGSTNSNSNIASGGGQNYGGSQDAFLVKFDASGARQWGTYYGGSSSDDGFSIATDTIGNVYLAGSTSSTSGIALNGYQNSIVGSYNAFLIKFIEPIIITQPPLSFFACSNSSVTLSLNANGLGLTYQWQIRPPSATQFVNITNGGVNNFSGSNNANLLIGNPSGLNGYSFQCVVISVLNTEISATSLLTVYQPPSIISQPISVATCPNQAAILSTSASGTGLTYQWQNSSVPNGAWINCTNGSVYSGSTTNTLQIPNVAGLNNYQYRCVVTNINTCSINSNVVTLTVYNTPSINSQPLAVTVCPNQTATFSINATGTGLTYQWQNRMGSSGSWVNCTNGAVYSGSNANTLQLINLSNLNNYQYRCVVTTSNACSATSNAVSLTVYSIPTASITTDGASANPVTINFGDATALVLSGSLNVSSPNIVWTPSAGLSSNSVANPIAYPTSSTNYTATFTNTFGCTQSVSQQVNVNSLPNSGSISVVSATGFNNFNVFDTLKVEVRLIGVSNIYAAYARLRYSGPLSPYLTYVGYSAGTILGTGAAVISTPPVAFGTYGYDFGISKIGSTPGYSGTGTLYTFYFKPNSIPTNLIGSQVCFFVDNLSITNATVGAAVGLVNQGPNCFNYSNQTVVWPGDLDNNKSVNTADLLKIGIFYNNTGPIRPNANLQWVAQPATLWGYNTSSPNSDAFMVFADGNGDGIINNADQTSVGFNMGKIHALPQPMDSVSFDRIATTGDLVVVPTPGYVSASAQSQQLDLSVSLANAGSTLNNLYGISFDIAVDTNVFDLQNTIFDYSGSIFGTPSQDFLNIEYVANGVVSVGMTRFNNPSINGNGLLCKIRLNTYSGLNYSGTNLTFNGTVGAANDSVGMPYAIGPASVQIPYGSSASITELSDDISQVLLYPNPAGELLNVIINEEVFVKEIKVLDETGRVVIIKTPNSTITKYTIETLNLAEGIYTIQLITKDGQIYKKFVKGE